MQTVRQNLLWAVFCNLVCIPAAALGIVNPSMAEAAMTLSSNAFCSTHTDCKRQGRRMRNERCIIKVRGMICRSCTDEVERTLTAHRGARSAEVSYLKAAAELEYDPDIVSLKGLEAAIKDCGYDTGDRGLSSIAVDIICSALTVISVLFFTFRSLNPIPKADGGAGAGYIFLIGLMTSTHCIGMCGGILLSRSAGDLQGGGSIMPSLCYNLGIVLSYTALGAVCGALGTVISYTEDTRSMLFCVIGLAVLQGVRRSCCFIPSVPCLLCFSSVRSIPSFLRSTENTCLNSVRYS